MSTSKNAIVIIGDCAAGKYIRAVLSPQAQDEAIKREGMQEPITPIDINRQSNGDDKG